MNTQDTSSIIKSLIDAPISPSAREIAGLLVDAWIEENAEFDSQYETLAVESPWYLWLDADRTTLLVGVCDRTAKDEKGPFLCEWKTAAEPKKNKDGSDSAWWNERVWLESISTGTQLAIYGLALSRGTFVVSQGRWSPNILDPRIMVRAAVKSSPVRFWPTRREDGVFQFPESYLNKVQSAVFSKAEQIRAARRNATFPWALAGNHCTNRFHKLCPYHQDFCVSGKHPTKPPTSLFDESDPGSAAIAAAGVKPSDIANHDLVIFSASSFDTAQQCVERYRILVGGYAQKEEDENLGIGTGLHTGIAAYYRQGMRENTKIHKNTHKIQKTLDTKIRKK